MCIAGDDRALGVRDRRQRYVTSSRLISSDALDSLRLENRRGQHQWLDVRTALVVDRRSRILGSDTINGSGCRGGPMLGTGIAFRHKTARFGPSFSWRCDPYYARQMRRFAHRLLLC